MKKYVMILATAFTLFSSVPATATGTEDLLMPAVLTKADSIAIFSAKKSGSVWDRFHVGGYGEVAFSRNFYSDNYLRYSEPDKYKGSHGRFDLPHVVLYVGYDFGKGWSFSSEIEFEHGGTESAVEIETEEAGEYESEIERGGEVALEQFYLQKVFLPQLKLRVGMQIVPVGATNTHHEPDQFFGVYRPEGENTIFPCTCMKWRFRYPDAPENGSIWQCSCRGSIPNDLAIKAGFTMVALHPTNLKLPTIMPLPAD